MKVRKRLQSWFNIKLKSIATWGSRQDKFYLKEYTIDLTLHSCNTLGRHFLIKNINVNSGRATGNNWQSTSTCPIRNHFVLFYQTMNLLHIKISQPQCGWTPSSITPPSSLYPQFSSRGTNACSSCVDPSVMNPSQREDIFILSQGAHPTSQILICRSRDGSDTQTDGTNAAVRMLSYQSSSARRCFLSPSRPLVYWHHQLNTTSSTICSTNDCVVKSINLQAAQTPGEMLSNKTKILKLLENHARWISHQTFFTNTTLTF